MIAVYVKRIELDNFKSHVKTSLEFSQGLNLILGANGAGKSSVLQALGFAFVGLKGDGSYGDFITNFNNADFANIRVDFVASDGLEYSIIRKIDPRKTSWEVISQTNKKWRGQNEVLPLLQNLLSIRGEPKKVYKRIITASQNDMTSAFLASTSERKAFFNDLFNTKIYKEISSKEMKSYVETVTSKISEINGSLNILEKQIEELSTTSQDISKSKEELKEIEEKLHGMEKIEAKRKRRLDLLRKNREKYLQLFEKKESIFEKIRGLESALKEDQKQLDNAQTAKKICEESRPQYEKFELLERERKEIERDRAVAEDDVKKLGDLEKESIEIKNAIERTESEILHENENIKKRVEELRVLENKIDSKKEKLENLEEKRMKKLTERNKITKELKSFQTLSRVVQKISDSLSKIDGRIEMTSKRIKNIDYLGEIEKLNYELEFLEKKEKELESIKEKKIELREKLNMLENSKGSLKNGVCPILQEKCLNIGRKDPSEYFDEKIGKIESKISSLEITAGALQKEFDRLQNVKNVISKLEFEKEENEKRRQELQRLLHEKERMNNELIASLKGLTDVTNLNPLDAREYVNSRLRDLSGKDQKIVAEVRSIEVQISDLRKDIISLEEEKRAHSDEIENRAVKIKEYEQQISKLSAKMVDLRSKIVFLLPARKNLEKLKKRYLELSNVMNQLKPLHEKYMKNIYTAKTVDEIRKRLEDTINDLKSTKGEFERISMQLEEISNSYSEEGISLLEKEISSLNEERNKLSGRVGSLEERIKSLEANLEKLKKAKERSKSLKKELEILEKKRYLAEEIRKMLDVMGPEMASRYRNFIAMKATEKYRTLTKKVDILKWNDDYDVHLISPVGKLSSDRRFSLLSGGEQMIVALAIRAALAETFSATRFAIFDEPTVNLDAERRSSLSEYLPKLFESMEQILVVTHDETFKEMAERVISVEKENGMSVIKV